MVGTLQLVFPQCSKMELVVVRVSGVLTFYFFSFIHYCFCIVIL